MRVSSITCVLLFLTCNSAGATQYVHEDAKTATKASHCVAPDAAEKYAFDRVKIDTGEACHAKGYGWHVEKIKTEGKLSCTPCEGGKTQCQIEDISLECKRLKPGSTGMGIFQFLNSD